ncbi:hypothetical protein V8F06_012155 [Rhypophila decipiens]
MSDPPATQPTNEPGEEKGKEKQEPDSQVESIQFKDAVGRKFTFPWKLAQLWAGMEELIKQAFLHVDVIGPHVQQGHYDLMGPDGTIILPQCWEMLVRPGMAISMAIWPMEKPPLRHQRHPPPPPGWPPGRPWPPPPPPPPAGAPLGPSGWTGPTPRPPAPPSGRPEDIVIDVEPRRPTKKKAHSTSVFGWLNGSKPKSSKKKGDGPARLPVSEKPAPPPYTMPRVPPPRPKSPSLASSKSSAGSDYSDSWSGHGALAESRKEAVALGLVFSTKLGKRAVTDEDDRNFKLNKRLTFHVSNKKSQTESVCYEILSAQRYAHGDADVEDEGSPIQLVYRHKGDTFPDRPAEAGLETRKMKWQHVKKCHMELEEFSHYACQNLSTSDKMFSIIRNLLDRVQKEKVRRTDYGCYVEHGTVLRCDGSASANGGYAIFAAIPYLYADSFSGSSKNNNPGIKTGVVCPPWRLHQAFSPFDASTQRDMGQQFRKYHGKKGNQVLWVGQVWVLITDSGFLTCGNISHQELLGDSISMEPEKVVGETLERMIEFVDPSNRLFYFPVARCRSFLELEDTVFNELKRANVAPSNGSKWELVTPTGVSLTPAIWQQFLRDDTKTLFRIEMKVTDSSEEEGEDERDSLKSLSMDLHSSDGTDIEIADTDLDANAANQFFSIPPHDETHNVAPDWMAVLDGRDAIATDVDFFLPEYDRKIPPFFTWSPQAQKEARKGNKASDDKEKRADILTKSLEHIELSLSGSSSTSKIIERYVNDLADVNLLQIYHQTHPTTYDDIAHRAKGLGVYGIRLNEAESKPQLLNEGRPLVILVAEQALQASLQVLELFAPKDLSSPVIGKFYGGILGLLESAASNSTTKSINDQRSTPKSPSGDSAGMSGRMQSRRVEDRSKWVVQFTEKTDDCSACADGKVYGTDMAAIDHLRKVHNLKHTTRDQLVKDHLRALHQVAGEKRRTENLKLMRLYRDQILRVTSRANAIHNGVATDKGFSSPGLPLALMVAFEMLVLYICFVGHALQDVDAVFEERMATVDELAGADLPKYAQTLEILGERVEGQLLKAQKVISTTTLTGSTGAVLHYSTVVGSEFVATQMICNLLRRPIYGGMDTAALFTGYLVKKQSEALAGYGGGKRHIRDIIALVDEIRKMQKILKWQTDITNRLTTVLSPTTFPKRTKQRGVLYELESTLLGSADDRIDLCDKRLVKGLESCEGLVETINEVAEMTKDEGGRAILIFTITTIVFLPLSFVASYLSMNGGPGETLDWKATQALFWQIAAPLAAVIIVLCVGLTYKAAGMGDFFGRWVSDWRGDKGEVESVLHSESSSSSSEDDSISEDRDWV